MKALSELLFRAKLNIDMQACRVCEDFEFKLAKAQQDIEGAYSVRQEVYVKELEWEHDTDKDQHDNQSVFIIAKRRGEYAACLRIIETGSTIDPSRPEISRLSIKKPFRGTKGLVICLYLAARYYCKETLESNEAVFLTKPALANSIGLAIGRIKKLDKVKEHRGLRAPYMITFTGISPGLRKLNNTALAQMEEHDPSKVAVLGSIPRCCANEGVV